MKKYFAMMVVVVICLVLEGWRCFKRIDKYGKYRNSNR
jgi:hypothetical protein